MKLRYHSRELQDSQITTSAAVGQLVLVVSAMAAILALASRNPLVTAVGAFVPSLLWYLLWRPGHPALLMFAALFQWLQAFTPVLSANLEGVTLEEKFGGPELELAAWYSLGTVVALSVGVWVVRHYSGRSLSPLVLRQESARLDTTRLFFAYFIASAASVVIIFIADRAGGLRQPILAFSSIKWVPIFLLAWTTLQHRRSANMLLIVVAIEIVMGLTGFFSTFKSILFMMIVVGLGTTIDDRRIRIGPVLTYGLLCLLLAAFWQTIKVDYRAFLNQGTGQQIVQVPVMDRLVFLGRATTNVTPEDLWHGSVDGLLRLGYIEYFAYSIRNVPSRIPYQNGDLWFGAIKHTLIPRIFSANKEVIDISARTNKFTLRAVAGHTQGTSISIGYPGESYIDFGPIGMYFPIFFLGCFYSLIYENFSRRGPYHLAGVSLATSLLIFTAHQLEMTNINLVGGIVTSTIAFWIVHKWVVPRIWPWLCGAGKRSF
jgi:hypothetical protein